MSNPQPEQQLQPWATFCWLMFTALLSSGLAAYANKTSFIGFFSVLVLGGLTGASELIARYRDAPFRILVSPFALIYSYLNAMAAIVALYFIQTFGWNFALDNARPEALALVQVLVGGFGAMAFFRSSLFNVRIGNQEWGVGPSSLLTILLNALDREVDRARAKERARKANRVMQGQQVDFNRAYAALPAYCLALMQNLSEEEQVRLGEEVNKLVAGTDQALDPAVKSQMLGLLIMNAIGEDVLEDAVQTLGDAIKQRMTP